MKRKKSEAPGWQVSARDRPKGESYREHRALKSSTRGMLTANPTVGQRPKRSLATEDGRMVNEQMERWLTGPWSADYSHEEKPGRPCRDGRTKCGLDVERELRPLEAHPRGTTALPDRWWVPVQLHTLTVEAGCPSRVLAGGTELLGAPTAARALAAASLRVTGTGKLGRLSPGKWIERLTTESTTVDTHGHTKGSQVHCPHEAAGLHLQGVPGKAQVWGQKAEQGSLAGADHKDARGDLGAGGPVLRLDGCGARGTLWACQHFPKRALSRAHLAGRPCHLQEFTRAPPLENEQHSEGLRGALQEPVLFQGHAHSRAPCRHPCVFLNESSGS